MDQTNIPTSPKENTQLVPLSIIVSGILIAGAIYFGGSRPATDTAATAPGANTTAVGTVAPVTSKDFIIGSPSAQIVVVEYSDFECPFCKVFHKTMHDIVDQYGGKVAWVYRQFPIASLHSKAPKESEAAYCAAEQGGNTTFWKFADRIFEVTESNNRLEPTQLPQIAGDIGIDVTAFNTCLSSGKYTSQVQADVTAASKAGAKGTPYSIIVTKSGKKEPINGAQPLASIKAQIDALLK